MRVEEEVITNNLLNSLDLRKDQLEFIIAKAKEIEVNTRDFSKEYLKYSERTRRFAIKVKQQVETGRISVDESVASGYLKNQKQRYLLYYEYNDVLREAIKAVEARLKDFQLAALDNFVTCTIPEVNENFIGADNKSWGLGLSTLGARWIPKERYEEEKELFIAKCIGQLKTTLCPCHRVREYGVVREEMLKAMEQVRKLDEADYMLNKDKLAKELEEKIILKDPELTRQEKIQQFLLSEQSIPVLTKRLRRKK